MGIIFRNLDISSKRSLIIGLLAFIILAGGVYYFLNVFNQNPAQGTETNFSSSKNNSELIADDLTSVEKDKEIIIGERASENFNGIEIAVVKIGWNSLLIDSGQEKAIIASGKEHDFGTVSVKVNFLNYSKQQAERKVSLRLSDSSGIPKENLSEGQGYEYILGESESAGINEYLGMLDVLSISPDRVLVKLGLRNATILSGETHDFGPLNVTVREILYTENDFERKASLFALPIPEGYDKNATWDPVPEDRIGEHE